MNQIFKPVRHEQAHFLALAYSQVEQGVGKGVHQCVQLPLPQVHMLADNSGILRETLSCTSQYLIIRMRKVLMILETNSMSQNVPIVSVSHILYVRSPPLSVESSKVAKGQELLLYSSIVVRSPGFTPNSRALSTRRMILPERVLGSPATNSNSEGVAIGPSS